MRRIIPTESVTRADCTRSTTHDTLIKIVDLEPNSRAMAVNFRGSADDKYISAKRAAFPFFKIETEKYAKTEGELLQVFQEVITEIKQKYADDPHKDDWVKQMKLAQEAWARFVEADQMAAAFYWRKAGTDKAQTEWKRMLTKQRILNLRKRYNARK